MARLVHYAAVAVNSVAVLALLFFMVMEGRSSEYWLFVLFLIPPVLSLVALYNIPGPDERKLAKELRMARMKKELSEITG